VVGRGVTAVLLLVLVFPALAVAKAQPKLPAVSAGPQQFPKVSTQRDVALKMRDGVVLRADVRRPADASGNAVNGRFPVVLTQTPYNKQSGNVPGGGTLANLAGTSDLIVTHGYVQVIVDVRGTGSSGGNWDSFGPAEQADSLEISRWATSQPWADGRLALYGYSYMGINQFLTAAQKPKGLKALFAGIPGEDLYRDVTWHGGAIDAGFIPLWLGLVTATKSLPPGQLGSDPASAVDVLGQRLTGGFNFPAESLVGGTTGGDFAFDGPFYKQRSPGQVVGKVKVPTFIAGGWFDLFQRGEPRLYNGLKLDPGRKQLFMGPWYHTTAGEGLGTGKRPPSLETFAVVWFDRWVKGKRNRIENYGPVTSFQLGSGSYKRYTQWPPRSPTWTRLFLRKDRTLSSAPADRTESDTMPANVLTGLCTRSTTQWTAGLVPPGQPCETDNSLNEAGALTFTTPPFAKDRKLSGPILVKLRGATTAKDTTWIATLSDVGPDGKSSQLTAGWLLASRRAVDPKRSTKAPNNDFVAPFHPFTRESLLPVEPGKRETYLVEVFNTDALLAKGHRLRLTITSGDVPHLLSTAPDTVNAAGAVNTVFYDAREPSYVTLPFVSKTYPAVG
jgi:predicted acyl esterase